MKEIILETARQWLETPYHHQGRVKGAGVDCIGLIIGICHELSLIDFDVTGYDRTPDSTMMMELLEKHCTRTDNPEPGDLLLFRIRKNPQHVGLMTDDGGIIHAYQSVGKVVEHPLDPWWSSRIIGAFVLPINFPNQSIADL